MLGFKLSLAGVGDAVVAAIPVVLLM